MTGAQGRKVDDDEPMVISTTIPLPTTIVNISDASIA
jgi:hypothetical protein